MCSFWSALEPVRNVRDVLSALVSLLNPYLCSAFFSAVEKARNSAWGEASRIKHAKLFKSIDRDGNGFLGKQELSEALNRSNAADVEPLPCVLHFCYLIQAEGVASPSQLAHLNYAPLLCGRSGHQRHPFHFRQDV